jgi:NADPH-dependent 2,4-dienoyl-CoA reductase/sulfur reductase-like enzyme
MFAHRKNTSRGHIKQAKNVPLTEIGRYSGQDSKVYVICQSGMRSRQATKILNKKGYDVTNIRGGMSQWDWLYGRRYEMKIIIIGGVAGGMSAATRLRRLMADAEIIVFDKGPFVSFANCGLPYYVSGEISHKAALLLQTPESLKARFNLDVRPLHDVTSISPEKHELQVSFEGKVRTESYDKLILSPGAKPFIPDIAGLDQAQNVFTLRNVPDLDRIMAHLTPETKTAVVIGAGFIGLEMAENLSKRGLAVTLIEKAPQVLPPLDIEMAAYVKNELIASGVTVKTSASALAFQAAGREIVLDTGEVVTTDLTILSVGVQPETSLAQAAGLKLGIGGGILVDDHYQTGAPDVYAVGDAIVVKQQLTGQDALIAPSFSRQSSRPSSRRCPLRALTASIAAVSDRLLSVFLGSLLLRLV